MIAGDTWGDVCRRAVAVHGQSPLYYLLVRLSTDLFGVGRVGMRLPSLLAGIGLLVAIYAVAVVLFRDRRVALMALAVAAVDDRLIFVSQDARPYALPLLFAVLSFVFYARWLQDKGRGALWGWVGCAVATYYANYLAGVVAVVQGMHFLAHEARRPRGLARGIVPFGVMALAMLPGLVQLAALHERREAVDWIDPGSGPRVWVKLLLGYLDYRLLAFVLGMAGVSALVQGARAREALRAFPGLVWLWLLVPAAALFLVSSLLGVSLRAPRYVIVMAPAAVLIYGFLLAFSARGPRQSVAILLVFLSVAGWFRVGPLLADGALAGWYRQHRWEEATRTLLREHLPGDLVLYRTGFVELDAVVWGEPGDAVRSFVQWPITAHFPAGVHVERRPLPLSGGEKAVHYLEHLLNAEGGGRRIWLVGRIGPVPELRDRLAHDPRFRLVRRRDYGLVELSLYEPI